MYLLLVISSRILQIDQSFGWRPVLSLWSRDVVPVQDVIDGNTFTFMGSSGPGIDDFAHDLFELVLERLSLPGYIAISNFASASFISIYIFKPLILSLSFCSQLLDVFINCSILLGSLDAHLLQILGVEQVHLSWFYLGVWTLRSSVDHIYGWLNIQSSCDGSVVFGIEDILLMVSWSTVVEVSIAHLALVLVDPIQISHQLARRHFKWALAPSPLRIVVWEPAPSVADLSVKKHLWHGTTITLSLRPEISLLLNLLNNLLLSEWLSSSSLNIFVCILTSVVLIFFLFLLNWSVFIRCCFFFILCFLFIYFLCVFLSKNRFFIFSGILRNHLNFLFLIWHFFVLYFFERFIISHFIHDFGFKVILTHVRDILLCVSSFDSVDNWLHVIWSNLTFETRSHTSLSRSRISSDTCRWWQNSRFFIWRCGSNWSSSRLCIWIFCVV